MKMKVNLFLLNLFLVTVVKGSEPGPYPHTDDTDRRLGAPSLVSAATPPGSDDMHRALNGLLGSYKDEDGPSAKYAAAQESKVNGFPPVAALRPSHAAARIVDPSAHLAAPHHPRRLQLGTWQQIGDDIDGESGPHDWSGYVVSMSADGKRLAIGAGGNGAYRGHVRVFDWNGTSWVQIGQDINGESSYDLFGYAVSLTADGKRLAIGSQDNNGTGRYSGHVRVFNWNGTSWVQLGQDIDGKAAGDRSGWSVSLSADGKRVAIGTSAYRYSGHDSGSPGNVRIFDWNGTNWVQAGQDIAEATDDSKGRKVSLSADGNRLAIGVHGYYDIDFGSSNHVQVFDWNSTSWVQIGDDIEGEAAGDGSGYSLALSADGKRLAIGAPGNDNQNGPDSGHVRVFDWDDTNGWIQIGQDIDGEAAGDMSGYLGVSLSPDANRLAIGAVFNDGTTGTESDDRGHVRVFDWDDTNGWIQIGQDIDGEAAGDRSGCSVSLSADGKLLAIGAYQNDGNGSNSGHVRVYKYITAVNKLGECEADCDKNKDCKEGLLCSDVHANRLALHAAGLNRDFAYCTGDYAWNDEVCYDPNKVIAQLVGNCP